MKLTVYIVDDELMAIKYLETLLLGTSLDIEIVGTAQNGVKAIPEIAKLHPDFVFADISMPIMDGLQMSERILQNNPLQKIFILTAYRDFSYAQKGISIGVANYFLKNELSEKSLEEVICKNITEMEKERRERHNVLETNIRNFFRENSSDGMQYWAYHDRPLQQYILIYFSGRPRIVLKHAEEKSFSYIDSYLIESEFSHEEFQLRAFVALSQHEYCGILFTQGDVKNIEWKCQTMIQNIAERYHINTREYICLVSTPVQNFDALQDTYFRLKKNIKYRYKDSRFIISEREQETCCSENNSKDVNDLILRWRKSFSRENKQESEELLNLILSSMCYCYDVWEFTDGVQEISHFLLSQIRQSRLNTDSFSVQETYTEVESLRRDLVNAQNVFFEERNYRRQHNYSRHIILAQEYIYKNYMNDISVADIANAAGISEGHLRRCFKMEMKVNVVHYLTEYRIEYAKKLMNEGSKNLDVIWKIAGFTSVQYFSSVFKKREGIAPREYMRKMGYEVFEENA